MLQRWGASIVSQPSQADVERQPATAVALPPKETPEHRELRLRKQYEEALIIHQKNEHQLAQEQFAVIAEDLRQSQLVRAAMKVKTSVSSAPFSRKRPRGDDTPLWERRLRYAVHRNLAEARYALQQYLPALEAYAAALDDDRSDFLIWLRAAQAATRCGRLHVARRAYETALSMRPAHWLCVKDYRVLLQSIGDADEDSNDPLTGKVDRESERDVEGVLGARQRCQRLERKNAELCGEKEPEVLELTELSWDHLVAVLGDCLESRLAGKCPHGTRHVAFPIRLANPLLEGLAAEKVDMVSDDSSDEVLFVAQDSARESSANDQDDMEVIVVTEVKGIKTEVRPEAELLGVNSSEQRHANETNAPTPNPVVTGEGVTDATRSVVTDQPNIAPSSQNEPQKLQEDRNNAASDHQNNQNMESVTVPREPVALLEGEKDNQKQPEVRRSSRQRTALEVSHQEKDRRQTRTIADMKDSMEEDKEFIQGLLALCKADEEKDQRSTKLEENECRDNAKSADLERPANKTSAETKNVEGKTKSGWVKYVDERTEAEEVQECLRSLSDANSGPLDLLQRVLGHLSRVKVAHHLPTLALLWSILRERLLLHLPGTATTTALIAEAMLEAGKKSGRVKSQRFQEACRLLQNIRTQSATEIDDAFLRIRVSWLWSLLHEARGEMQLSFSFAEETLKLLEEAKPWPSNSLPEVLGPSLSGHTCQELSDLFSRRISALKSSRDLEKAKEELRKNGNNKEAAERTMAILLPSIHASIRELQLDVWQEDDLKEEFSSSSELEEWERRLDAEVELEPRLTVFADACVKSSDILGELVCFSARLRTIVHHYTATVREEAKTDKTYPDGTVSSSVRLADLLSQIRKYVALIKKLSGSDLAKQLASQTVNSSWSLKRALSIASITLVTLSALLVTKIPLLRFTPSSTELGASQRNKRLGFMRCMLALVRCVLLKAECSESSTSKFSIEARLRMPEKETQTRQILAVISFCLKAMAARGCCREEGTSGALIKLYTKFLLSRLLEITSRKQQQACGKKDRGAPGKQPCQEEHAAEEIMATTPARGEDGIVRSEESSREGSDREEDTSFNVSHVRHELSQCFQCLYRIDDLEMTSGDSAVLIGDRWLEEGCQASSRIGLNFNAADASSTSTLMDVETCKNVYFFYRKRIFEGMCRRRRDGGKGKRIREVLSRLAEALPENPPQGVAMLPFHALDSIVSDVVETKDDISREAAENVSRLEEAWSQRHHQSHDEGDDTEEKIRQIQLSILFFEVFALHAMLALGTHEAEYKKQKNAERRKRPKEAAERLLTASSECIIALRSRPWSVGAWILLGRIFVEISDLALDERELNFSSFGLYRTDDLASLADGEGVETVFGRAKACFGFAESLLKHPWAKEKCNLEVGLSSAQVLGTSCPDDEDQEWCGFGDDGDLFGFFGLMNTTTSRPTLRFESHPSEQDERQDIRRIAAIRLGEAALSVIQLREQRYFHSHWNQSSMECRLAIHPENRFPASVNEMGKTALQMLREGQRLFSLRQSFSCESARNTNGDRHALNQSDTITSTQGIPMNWRYGYDALEKSHWYFHLQEAKLARKTGGSPQEYLALFHQALNENRRLRESLKQPADIEPVYKLHASRMKILRTIDNDANAGNMLTLLEKYSFIREPIVVDVARTVEGREAEEWITERKIAVAEDILSAMQSCRHAKSDVAYAEYYYKAAYCRALVLAELLKDTSGALEEMDKLFGIEAAAKVLDNGPDGKHRGYFYKMWNYRFTDTGIEPALESERKFVRWRSKTLGLYSQLLKQSGEWRLLAAIIYRLRKRSAEDLPIDGALLDDLIMAYAKTSRTAILNSMEKGIVSSAAVFEASYRRTWDIYVETLRLAQGVKRVRANLSRGERSETGGNRLLESRRPWCLPSIHTTLRLEHMRWRSALNSADVNGGFNIESLKSLPTEGSMDDIPQPVRLGLMETVQVSASKWPLDEKLMRLLVRRVSELTATP